MSKQPGRPVDEEGKSSFPATTDGTEDVQGHIVLVTDPEQDQQQDDVERPPRIVL